MMPFKVSNKWILQIRPKLFNVLYFQAIWLDFNSTFWENQYSSFFCYNKSKFVLMEKVNLRDIYLSYVTTRIKGAIESKLYFMFVLVFIEVWKYNNLGKNSHDDKKLRIEPELLSAGRSTNVLASTSIQKPSCSLLKRVIRECLI